MGALLAALVRILTPLEVSPVVDIWMVLSVA